MSSDKVIVSYLIDEMLPFV